MAFLVIEGQEVGAGPETDRDLVEIGERGRMFSGRLRSSISARKKEWHIQTPPLPRADADALETLLLSAPSLACAGDLLGGAVTCTAEVTGWTPVIAGAGHRVRLAFRLREV